MENRFSDNALRLWLKAIADYSKACAAMVFGEGYPENTAKALMGDKKDYCIRRIRLWSTWAGKPVPEDELKHIYEFMEEEQS